MQLAPTSVSLSSVSPVERGRTRTNIEMIKKETNTMSYSNSAIAHTAAPVARIARYAQSPAQANPAQPSADWQARAISSYRHAQSQALTVLPELLATRVSSLTGRSVEPADVFVDQDAELATVVVDGVVFRAHNHQVVVLRSCVECGITRFESAPLFSRADLGYALSAWRPRCTSCQLEDSANWLESEVQSII
jgi:hypothetical protein